MITRVLFTIATLTVCAPLCANPISGKISNIILETEDSHFKMAGYVSLQLSGQTTGPKCTFLYLSPKDSAAISFAQQAFIHNIKVKVFYKEESQAPWGIGACAIKTIEARKHDIGEAADTP